MKLNFVNVALGIILSATTISASAQKAYKEGTVTYTATVAGQSVDSQLYFKADSSSTSGKAGPASFKTIMANNGDYLAIILDVPIANIKKAFIGTPAELEQAKDMEPDFKFAPGTETKVINGFNCKKVTVTDSKSKQTYEAWVTNDVSIPVNILTKYYAAVGGFPIQFTTVQQGQALSVLVKTISDAKAPTGTFSIPAGYERGTLSDMAALRGGR